MTMGTASVKNDLKSKILRRRQVSGLGDIVVDFSPKPSYPLTADEVSKERNRKQSNRLSARNSRLKSKEHQENYKKLLEQEEQKFQRLQNSLKRLEVTKQKVLFQLRDLGLPDSYIQDAFNNALQNTQPVEKETSHNQERHETVAIGRTSDEYNSSTNPGYSNFRSCFETPNHANVPSSFYSSTYLPTTHCYDKSTDRFDIACGVTDFVSKNQFLDESTWMDSEDLLRNIDIQSLSSISPENVADVVDELNPNSIHMFSEGQ